MTRVTMFLHYIDEQSIKFGNFSELKINIKIYGSGHTVPDIELTKFFMKPLLDVSLQFNCLQFKANKIKVKELLKLLNHHILYCTQGLGHTVPEIELAKFNIKAFEKTCFTMCLPALMDQLKANILS